MRLYLVRHGKAEKQSPTGRDEDRPLQPRGERQSRWLGETLVRLAEGDRPALLLASPALRADQTARIINEQLHADCKTEPALNLGEPVEHVLDLLKTHPGRHAPLMLVGHNPTMEILLSILVEGVEGEAAEMRTGEAAVIELPIDRPLDANCRLVGRMRYPD